MRCKGDVRSAPFQPHIFLTLRSTARRGARRALPDFNAHAAPIVYRCVFVVCSICRGCLLTGSMELRLTPASPTLAWSHSSI